MAVIAFFFAAGFLSPPKRRTSRLYLACSRPRTPMAAQARCPDQRPRGPPGSTSGKRRRSWAPSTRSSRNDTPHDQLGITRLGASHCVPLGIHNGLNLDCQLGKSVAPPAYDLLTL